jgi:hypothetical protein
MRVEFGLYPRSTSTMVEFLRIDTPLAYNVILEKNTQCNWGYHLSDVPKDLVTNPQWYRRGVWSPDDSQDMLRDVH